MYGQVKKEVLDLLVLTKCMSLLRCHICPYSRAINSVLLTHRDMYYVLLPVK